MENYTGKPTRSLIFWIVGILTVAVLVAVGAVVIFDPFNTFKEIPVSDPIYDPGDQDSFEPDLHTEASPETTQHEIDLTDLQEVFSPFWTTRELLHDNFIDQPIDDSVLAAGAVDGLTAFLEENEVDLSEAVVPENALTPVAFASKADTPDAIIEEFLPFWELWQKVEYAPMPEDTDRLDWMRRALSGMVASLGDDYTNYYDPELTRQYNTDLTGEYEGIGAWVDTSTEYLTIVSPIADSPAEEAGLKPGDQIIAIGGKDMTGVDPNVVLTQVLGPAGTKVTLTIQREEQPDPFDVEIIRRRIVIPYIETEMLENDIAYIHLARFYENGDNDFRDALEDLLDQNPQGLIVDLRGNGGGYLHIVVSIASEFISDSPILIEEFGDGSRKNYPAVRSRGLALDIPLVVLVDGGSASASEIFAGAIRDYDRGVLIGETTFGKGLVQLPITLPDDQGLVSITIARWLTPSERSIQDSGITPDILVEITEEDIENERDPQLDRAVEYLLTGE